MKKMDETISETKVNARSLTMDGDLRIVLIYDEIGAQEHLAKNTHRELRGTLIVNRGIVLASTSIELKNFQVFLKHFALGNMQTNEENEYFEVVSKKIQGENSRAIRCKFNKNMFLSKVEAMSAVMEINESLVGLSKKRYYENSNSPLDTRWNDSVDWLYLQEELVRVINCKADGNPDVKKFTEHLKFFFKKRKKSY